MSNGLDEGDGKTASRKELSAAGLLGIARRCFGTVADPVARRGGASLADCLMSGLAMFGLKYASLPEFDEAARGDDAVRGNLRRLYGVDRAPSDTRMRERLDEVDPRSLRSCYRRLFAALQRGVPPRAGDEGRGGRRGGQRHVVAGPPRPTVAGGGFFRDDESRRTTSTGPRRRVGPAPPSAPTGSAAPGTPRDTRQQRWRELLDSNAKVSLKPVCRGSSGDDRDTTDRTNTDHRSGRRP